MGSPVRFQFNIHNIHTNCILRAREKKTACARIYSHHKVNQYEPNFSFFPDFDLSIRNSYSHINIWILFMNHFESAIRASLTTKSNGFDDKMFRVNVSSVFCRCRHKYTMPATTWNFESILNTHLDSSDSSEYLLYYLKTLYALREMIEKCKLCEMGKERKHLKIFWKTHIIADFHAKWQIKIL